MGRHILVKLRVLAGSAVVLGMLCAALAAGCIEDKGQQPAEYEQIGRASCRERVSVVV